MADGFEIVKGRLIRLKSLTSITIPKGVLS